MRLPTSGSVSWKLACIALITCPLAARAGASIQISEGETQSAVESFFFKQVNSCQQRLVAVVALEVLQSQFDLTGEVLGQPGSASGTEKAIAAVDITVDTCAETTYEQLFLLQQISSADHPSGQLASNTNSCTDINQAASQCPWAVFGNNVAVAAGSGASLDSNGVAGKAQMGVAFSNTGRPLLAQSLIASKSWLILRGGNDAFHQSLAQVLNMFVAIQTRVIDVQATGAADFGNGDILREHWDDTLQFRFDLTDYQAWPSYASFETDPGLTVDDAEQTIVQNVLNAVNDLTASATWVTAIDSEVGGF